jgi:hypothetical protein
VPRFKKVEKENDNEEDSQVLIGFIAVPVFAVEDTDGEPLPDVTPREIPQLQAVADFLGLAVRYAGAHSRTPTVLVRVENRGDMPYQGHPNTRRRNRRSRETNRWASCASISSSTACWK